MSKAIQPPRMAEVLIPGGEVLAPISWDAKAKLLKLPAERRKHHQFPRSFGSLFLRKITPFKRKKTFSRLGTFWFPPIPKLNKILDRKWIPIDEVVAAGVVEYFGTWLIEDYFTDGTRREVIIILKDYEINSF